MILAFAFLFMNNVESKPYLDFHKKIDKTHLLKLSVAIRYNNHNATFYGEVDYLK